MHIGDYDLIELLGSGAFGAVWLARDDRTGSEVAVKLLHAKHEVAQSSAGPTPADRFLQESKLLMELDHPGLVKVREVIDARPDGGIACVMDRVKGQTLRDLVSQLDLAAVVEIFSRVAATLAYVHQRGVVHRDVKLSNIMVSDGADRAVKVIDFGVAKDLEALLPTATATGCFVGTPAMTSPECFRRLEGEDIELTPREDQWSLGVAFFHALTGNLPFSASTIMQLRDQVLTRRVPAIRLLPNLGLGACPQSIEHVVRRMLEKEPERRYRSMVEVASALHTIAEELTVPGDARTFQERLTSIAPAPFSPETFRSPAALPDIDIDDPMAAVRTVRSTDLLLPTQRTTPDADALATVRGPRVEPTERAVSVAAPPPPAALPLSSALMWVGVAAALAFAVVLLIAALGY